MKLTPTIVLMFVVSLALSTQTHAASNSDIFGGILDLANEAAKQSQQKRREKSEQYIPVAEETLTKGQIALATAKDFGISSQERKTLKKELRKADSALNDWKQNDFRKNLEKHIGRIDKIIEVYSASLQPLYENVLAQQDLKEQATETQEQKAEQAYRDEVSRRLKSVEHERKQQQLASQRAQNESMKAKHQRCVQNEDRYKGNALNIRNINLSMCPGDARAAIKNEVALQEVALSGGNFCFVFTDNGNLQGKGIASECDENGSLTSLLFNCNVTNSCELSVTELAQALVDNVVGLNQLDISTEMRRGVLYQGRATTGETVYVLENKSVQVVRGLLGESGPTF